MSETTTTVKCPTCGKASPWNTTNRWRPFCSERCKLVDLSEWIDESRRIPGDADTLLPPDSNQDDSDGS